MRFASLAFCILCSLPQIGLSDTIVAARTIRAQSILTAQDLAIKDIDVVGGVQDASVLIGKESRTAIYAGRPIRATDVGAPTLIERNQVVQIVFQNGTVNITAEGRSLDRAGAGEIIRVMNLSSRKTVFGKVALDGRVFVSY